MFSYGVLVGVLLVSCLEVGELVVWWSFAGCFSLGDGGLGSGGLKYGFTTRFWRGEGGVLSGGFRWSFGGCFGGISSENGENE
ncbi:hypothetical protein H5410_059556 [Solanum commersonii]|uniref:Uncharacterized protein n=1 Tax=Solanum commersonii TaxID=4109 RepID=A0A9J5W3U5_SOLCO|nr:hypothetical protein H5410_059556 [Solanum commersonii]